MGQWERKVGLVKKVRRASLVHFTIVPRGLEDFCSLSITLLDSFSKEKRVLPTGGAIREFKPATTRDKLMLILKVGDPAVTLDDTLRTL